MAQFQIDLHAHTTASDGTFTPSQLVEKAKEHNLRVLGITDHDTIDGVTEAMAAGQRLGIDIVPGVEFSLRHEYDKDFVGLHLLAYFIDPESPALIEVMAKVRHGRVEQKIRQIEKLQALGFDIPTAEVFAKATGVPGRPHIAAVLLERNPDKFTGLQQIYDEYLGTHAKAHVGRPFSLTLGQAVDIIKQAGGLPVFAHPGAYDTKIDPILAIHNAKAEGVEGVEVFYPYDDSHRPTANASDWVAYIDALADELGLLKTGGTDFHGRAEDMVELGDTGLTEPQFSTLKEGWQRLRNTAN